MADVYYDKTSWKPYEDQSRYRRFDESYGAGTGWKNYEVSPYGEMYAAGEDTNYGDPYKDYLKSRFDVSPLTQGWLGGIEGMTPDKAEAGIQEYFRQNGQGWDDWRFWGDDARLRAVGTGLDALNPDAAWKGSWQPQWNRARELAGQKDIAQDYEANEKAMGSDLGDILSAAKGFGLILGAGGLAGSLLGGATGGVAGASGGLEIGGIDNLISGWNGGSLAGTGSAGLSGLQAADAAAALGGEAAGTVANTAANAGSAAGTAAEAGGNMFDFSELFGEVNPWDVPAGDIANVFNNSVPTQDLSFLEGLGQPTGGLPDVVGSDWASGLDTAMNAGAQAGGGAGGGLSSALSNLKNLPTSALKSMFGLNDADAGSLAKLLGTLGTGALSYLSADKYADSMKEISDRSWNAGAPYRDRLSATYTNPGAYLDSPEVQAILNRSQNAMGRALSARDGNPVGSGRALTEMNDYAAQTLLGQLGSHRQQLANFGGQSQLTGNYNALATGAAGAGSNVYNSLARTANNVFNPQPDISQYLKMLGIGGANGLA